MTVFDPANAVLFLGAGISFDSGAPGFKELRDFFLEPILGVRTSTIEMRDLSPEQIFDLLDDGRRQTREDVRAALWRACEATDPNPNHYAAAILADEGARLWTPNFDTLIERSAARVGINLDVRTNPSEPRSSRPLLNKVHGSFPYTGDPPREPASHDYELLFSTPSLWNRLEETWSRELEADLTDRALYLFGYRGADLDIVPTLLDLASRARYVEWWDVDATNLAHLASFFGVSQANIVFRHGNPSSALRAAATPYLAARKLTPANPTQISPDLGVGYGGTLSHISRCNVLAMFEGSAAARRELAKGVLVGPRELRSRCAWSLTQSAGFDIRPVGATLAFALSVGSRIPWLAKRLRMWVVYASIVDALPLRRSDSRDLARLAASPFVAKADVLVRLASKHKRQGDLEAAATEATLALDELRARREPNPFLEAMAVYNLLWLHRQRWDIPSRDLLYERYEDRLAYVGFNWAGWITIEQAGHLASLGKVALARDLVAAPRMTYARAIGHPMLVSEMNLIELIVDWCEYGATGIGHRLDELVLRTRRRESFAHVSSLLLRANLATADGDRRLREALLVDVRSRARSRLQLRQADLVEAVARGDAVALAELVSDGRFGLISETARAVQGFPSLLVVEKNRPLPALF
jgi:hypothetical protein